MLTDTLVRALKPRHKVYRKADAGGLCIEVRPTGAKKWRFRYRFAGRPNMLDLGDYPGVSLQDARRERDRQKQLLARGEDPSQARRKALLLVNVAKDDTFEAIANEWLGQQAFEPQTVDKARMLFEYHIFPWIGRRPVRGISPTECLALIRRAEHAGKFDIAKRIRQRIGQVSRYAITTGRADVNPAEGLKGAMKVVKPTHHASLTDRKEVGALLRAIQGYSGHFVTRIALQVAPYVFVRPGELRHMEWTELDLDAGEWRLPAGKMKMRVPHIVPLARQVIVLLKEIQALTGRGRYVFPSVRTGTRPISENTINASLRRMGYSKNEATGHGFRSTASTILNEMGWNADWVERQLAHSEKDGVRGSYNYAQYLPGRREMMQAWADLLDSLRDGGKVVALPKQRA